MRWAPRLRRTDLWWLLATPLYFVVGTLRHEASHAAAVLLRGGDVTRFVVWPQRDLGHLTFGYVTYSDTHSWVVTAAPYLVDLLVFLVGTWVCRRLLERSHGLWLNVLVLTSFSSLLNSVWNYRPRESPRGDVWWLLHLLPDAAVHAWFLATGVLYALGVLALVGTIRPRDAES